MVGQSDQCVVKEHIEPLLVECYFLLQQISLAAVNQLVVSQMLFQTLYNSNAHLHIMSTVREDQLASLLPFVWALFDQSTVTPKQMFLEESVELRGARQTLDDLLGKQKNISECAFYWAQFAKHHLQKSETGGCFCS